VVAAFSPRSARIFADSAKVGAWNLEATTIVALSPAADAGLGAAAFARRIVAATPTREGMIAALAQA
jgi:hypothetical protein